MHTNTFCKYRKKLLASPRVHLVMYVDYPGLGHNIAGYFNLYICHGK